LKSNLFLVAGVAGLCAASIAAGCGNNAPASSSAPGAAVTAPVAKLKVALLVTGPTTDHGWNEAAFDGLMKIKSDLGATIATQETDSPSQFESAFTGFASQGFDVIFAHGDEYADSAAKAAKQFPKVDFVTTGGDRVAPNLAPIVFATEQGTYLQGMEAGFLTKTNKAGFVGGEALPPVVHAEEAFAEGGKAVNPKFTVAVTYLNSWDDTQKAKAQTDALIASGADMIAHNCDAAAAGLFQSAAAHQGVYSFGVNSDQNDQAPNVISSAYLDIPNAFVSIAKSVQDGSFKGEPLYLGIQAGDIKLIDNPKLSNLLTDAQKAKIEQAQADIESGKIDLKPKSLL
jgi:basic membrane lipoprotein Med (substrate-binding protein (PBP1-ABC) superfamily)